MYLIGKKPLNVIHGSKKYEFLAKDAYSIRTLHSNISSQVTLTDLIFLSILKTIKHEILRKVYSII